MTVVSSPLQLALVRDVDHDYSIEEIRNTFIKDVDIILTEGFKANSNSKIEVFRSQLNRELLCKKEDNLLAVATDIKLDIGVPCLDINDARSIADLIERTFLKEIQASKTGN